MKEIGKTIQSVQRAIDILNCFQSDKDQLSLTQISETLDLNKSTVHGIVNTLRNNDYMSQSETGKYLLGSALLNKSVHSKSLQEERLSQAGHDPIALLSNQTNSSTCLFFFHYKTPYLLQSVAPENALYQFKGDFNNTPLYSSASGKLALSLMSEQALDTYLVHCPFRNLSPFTITDLSVLKEHLEEIRKKGYSMELEEVYEGIASVSVPIYEGGDMIGSLSITNTSQFIQRHFDRLLRDLQDASRKIEENLS